MPLITALEKQKRRPRFDLYIEGVCADNVALVIDGEVVELNGSLILGEFGSGKPQYWVYRIQRSGC